MKSNKLTPKPEQAPTAVQLPNGQQVKIGDFKPLRMVLFVAIGFILISAWTAWYSRSVSMPRYCDDPAAALDYLQQIISQPTPAGDKARRPYLIAAKLLYLVPRKSAEPLQDYLYRVRGHIEMQCLNRGGF
ncbi:MAG: hypothetical protein QGG88_01095 [Gammaproteobacteria bacterium]|jgi:hypothetical protein|nr:hypothetical protein [Gammaproteobacteria bacterium]